MEIELKRKGGGLRLRVKQIFEKNKILTRQTADQIIAGFDDKQYYYSNTLHGTTVTNDKYHPFYVLALLNSRFMTWYYRKNTAEEGKVFAQVKIELLRLLPIFVTSSDNQKFFVNIVAKINKLGKHDEDKLLEYRKQIDKQIYKLYRLTDEEIEIIEKMQND